MLYRTSLFFLTGLLLQITATQAASTPANSKQKSSSMYFDLMALAGYSSPTVVSGAKVPILGQYGAGTTIAYKFFPFLFSGITSDYRIAAQYSDVSKTIGNFGGSRFNYAAPTIGFVFPSFTLKLDFQFLGDYKLSKTTTKGESIQYKNPQGARAILLLPFTKRLIHMPITLGLNGEYMTFDKQNSSSLGLRDLSPNLVYWQAGLVAAYVF